MELGWRANITAFLFSLGRVRRYVYNNLHVAHSSARSKPVHSSAKYSYKRHKQSGIGNQF